MMETALSEKDLIVVLKATHSGRNKWYNIGLELGVESHTLDSIGDRFDDPTDCLREVIKQWLKGVSPQPTWRALVDALRSCVVGEEKLASELEAKHCDTPAQGAGSGDGQMSSPEFSAMTKAKPELVERLNFSFLQLKDQCQAAGLITFDEVQANFDGRGATPAGDTSLLLDVVLSRIKTDPSLFSNFVSLSLLQDPAHAELVTRMGKLLEDERAVQQRPPTALGASGASIPGADTEPYTRLRSTLRELHQFERTDDIAKQAFDRFVVSSLNSGLSQAQVLAQLDKLHSEELLLSADLYKHAKEIATTTYAESAEENEEPVPKPEQPLASRTEPLFCKDTVYHAGVCSLAVSTCDAGNLPGLFKDRDKVPGHSFKEVSISRSKQNRYLVARQGDSTFYFAFQSEPKLSEWPKQFKSFYEGVKAQSEKFPVRFLVELLNKRNYIVLTGFSFGGLLATALAAMVWNTPYIGADLLRDHMVCITFGQPHVTVPLLADVARQRAELTSTIHCIYSQDDMVPRLMSYLDESWSYLISPGGKVEGKTSLPVKVPDEMRAPFHDPVTSVILEQLVKMQEAILTTEALQHLQSKLTEVAAVADAGDLPTACTTAYLMSTEEGGGLVFNKMTPDQATRASNYLQPAEIQRIHAFLFKEHVMFEASGYCQKLFRGHLEKAPKYALPPVSKHPPGPVSLLKPAIEGVELRYHGSETAVALEGKNLWFCYQLSVGGHSEKTPPQDLSGTSIQFNIPKGKPITTDGGTVRVITHSHFTKAGRQEVAVSEKKGYDVSSRQKQLAKLTPSKLIELAYLSALLEQHPHSTSEPVSSKVEVIRKFLSDVVHVVPLESIAYAIAHSPYEIAMVCYRALRSSGVKLPCSVVMQEGLIWATRRLSIGVSSRIVKELQRKARMENPAIGFGFRTERVVLSEDNLQLVNFPRVAGTYLLSSLNAATATTKLQPQDRETATNAEAASYLYQVEEDMVDDHEKHKMKVSPHLCGENIELLYPSSTTHPEESKTDAFTTPVGILAKGRKKLAALAMQVKDEIPSTIPAAHHKEMLRLVNEIRTKELATCTSLLSGFMEQEIDIPLMKSRRDQSEVVELSAQATIGVWALFSLRYCDIQPILAQCHGDQLLVKIEEYVKAIVSDQSDTSNSQYAAKLQFLVQGMEKTVTCNSQYVSYSLERQLSDLCENQKIDLSISLDTLLVRWGKLFKEQTLSLVARPVRPLVARWLKWALMVHNLREELAKYTAVGVTGLVNSGKSKLVSTLFGIQIPVGTSEAKRTTVPFMYNLDEDVEGLDVVDFPGVDDEDDTIPDLADLLLTIAQIIIFVVDYRKVHTQSAKKWLERLMVEKVPVLVCLTFADKFYAEHMTEDGEHPGKEAMRRQIEQQLSETRRKLGSVPSRTVRFFSFSQDRDSVLNTDEGRRRLRDVGIGSPQDVGDWLVEMFRKDFRLESLADRLDSFIHTE